MEYRPRPDFQPHLTSLPYRAESQQMGILTVGGPQALGDRPCRARHHVAVCKQESLSFMELPNLQPPSQGDFSLVPCSSEGWGLLSSHSSPMDGWGSLQLSPEGWPPCHHSYPDFHPRLGWIPDSGVPLGGNAASGSSGTHPGVAGIAVPQGRQGVGKADSQSHGTTSKPCSPHSNSFLHDIVNGPTSLPLLPESQGRGSHRVEKEKLAWRKIRVYSPETLSNTSPSLDGDAVFPGSPVHEDGRAAGELALRGMEPLGLRPAPEGPPHAVPETLDLALPPCSAGRSAKGSAEQERRRFSASELMNKLQLAQRRATFSLKLSKSLSSRSASKEKGAWASQEGKLNGRDQSRSSTGSDGLPSPELPSEPGNVWSRSEAELGGCLSTLVQHERLQSRFLLNSVLYQEYSDAAIAREIQRQQREDALAEEEEAALAPPKTNLSPSSSFRSQRSSRGSTFSLWQDIPDVRGSGLLSTISLQECKLQEAKFELITSEASYIHSLSIAVEHFMNSRQLNECLGAQEKQWLFSKLPEVKEVSERFLLELEERLEANILRFDICDIVLRHCPAFRRVYLPYVTNQAYQEQTYQRLLQDNPKFPGILAKLEEGPMCQRLPLTSFLILPFQRVMRLQMLVENILKRTLQGSRDEATATKAFNQLKKLVKECNASVQSMKRTEELIHLNKKIHFESKIFPLISQSRWLVKHGELVEVDMQLSSTLAAMFKLSTKTVYLHLFNDCLLLSRRKETGKFAVFVHAKMPELKVTDLSRKLHGVPGQIFHLQLFDSQRLKHQVLLRAQTESEKQRWISAMVPSSPQSDREHVTENADIAQVQCIKAYKAQEHDELSLEKADILGVKTRTSDGWLEGIRLSDGERGWVPQGHVEEITSRGARLRNLRENDRLKRATRKLEEEQE
ncbi:rho guanine nucleotide exchange factor 19 isoform X1 [Chelonoidis abingdonii]|uniref:rho guanine nucleotide exchange factor 19 isoform X1 n=2 Tax=Chelonoidis abingdonii TaxID=106734 RepID=UPI0013F29803|nr:rho guanine nucleotide exchange factor 19 isoform X1 [Chelonoidis abingdonii]XP_032643480.1 rho guanine nucleotide exchange factor 19 isoform X1 [Chelonoidis abingdonii]